MGWALLALVFLGLSWLVWSIFHEQIRAAIRWLRYGEMWIASWFLDKDYTVSWNGQPVNYHELMNAAAKVPSDRLDGQFMSLLAEVALYPYLVPIGILSIAFGIWALFKGPGTEHRSKFNIDTLIKKQANIFPIIAPFINFNPSKQPPRAPGAPVPVELPLFAEALGPEEWVVYNEVPVINNKIDEEAANKAFAKQLGPRWRGAKHLSPHKQILLAAFCLKASRRRGDSDTMLGRLAHCWTEKDGFKLSRDRGLLREARSVLSNQDIAGKILRKCNEHAWETTALIRALATAREEGGVLAPAQFVWLRGHDRTLWYPLNNLGRQSFHMEAMGAMAHYKGEKMAQRPIPRPKVNDAVSSLVEYLASNKVRTLPQLDYSGSKKRGVKKLKTA